MLTYTHTHTHTHILTIDHIDYANGIGNVVYMIYALTHTLTYAHAYTHACTHTHSKHAFTYLYVLVKSP